MGHPAISQREPSRRDPGAPGRVARAFLPGNALADLIRGGNVYSGSAMATPQIVSV